MKCFAPALPFFALLAGCDAGLLDLKPADKIASNSFWASANDARLALNGCYAKLDGSFGNAYLDGYADNAFAQYPWESRATVVSAGDISSSLDVGYSYEGIRRFSFFLDNLHRAPLSDEVSRRYRAEVRAIRALSYFNLAQTFGPVPLLTASPADPAAAMVAPTPEAEVAAFAIAELEAAIPDLPERAEAPSRFSRGAALALQARILLHYGRWAEAAAAAQKVMQLGYRLFRVEAPTADDLRDDYSAFVDFADEADRMAFYRGLCSYEQQFWERNEANPEVILSVEYLPKDPNFTSYMNALMLPGDVGGASSITPTQELVNAYWRRDGSPFTPPSASERAARYSKGNFGPEFLQEFRNRDTRLYASILFPGARMSYLGAGYVYRWVRGGLNFTTTGYNFRKLADPYDPSFAPGWNAPQDFPLIRYAEVLLTYAEARNEADASPHPSVYDAIDQLRSRAGMPPVDRAAYASREQLRELIRNERRIELAGEGFRWGDIRRWGIAPKVMRTIYAIDSDKVQDRRWDDRFLRMPYPQSAVDRNPNLREAQKAKGY